MKPTKSKFIVLKQICEYIPRNLVSKLANEHQVSKKCRTFSAWSHVVSLIFAQLSHSLSLNDVCDTLQNHRGLLLSVRRATPPSRNGLSHANTVRSADMAESLFWNVLSEIQAQFPKFGQGRNYSGFPRRFKRMIHVVDSTTIELVANCMNWAKHRRRKAAAKCHLRMNLETFLPTFIIVKEADTHDSIEAEQLCMTVKDGEIIIFDRAYMDFDHLSKLNQRGVFFVTRAKINMAYEIIRENSVPKGIIKSDQIIRLTGTTSLKSYPTELRVVTADLEVDGRIQTMTFLTNNREWSASSICDLYKARWSIEVFFKQLKQTLQLADFLGHSQNAVRWQIWTALLTYVLLRFLAFLSKWKGSFSRLFTFTKGILWSQINIVQTIERYGTADGPPLKFIPTYYQPLLPGFTF